MRQQHRLGGALAYLGRAQTRGQHPGIAQL